MCPYSPGSRNQPESSPVAGSHGNGSVSLSSLSQAFSSLATERLDRCPTPPTPSSVNVSVGPRTLEDASRPQASPASFVCSFIFLFNGFMAETNIFINTDFYMVVVMDLRPDSESAIGSSVPGGTSTRNLTLQLSTAAGFLTEAAVSVHTCQ